MSPSPPSATSCPLHSAPLSIYAHLAGTGVGVFHELWALRSAVSSEWIWRPAFFMCLPPLSEGFLEYGSFEESLKRIFCGFDPMAEVFPSGMFYWLFILILFTFQNKTRAAAVRNALVSGMVNCNPTGRRNANTHSTLLESFFQYLCLHHTDGEFFLTVQSFVQGCQMERGGGRGELAPASPQSGWCFVEAHSRKDWERILNPCCNFGISAALFFARSLDPPSDGTKLEVFLLLES